MKEKGVLAALLVTIATRRSATQRNESPARNEQRFFALSLFPFVLCRVLFICIASTSCPSCHPVPFSNHSG